ncbi:MAG: DUF4321 domain-containing protein [Eubacteriales bacterium]|nr:DUF4321 domain-containing protein [Bacillota bacterium]MBV1727008.1 DUF4321 domain-containing protein [Desulforudis sp.]MDQ7789869.1 DUF4321 domain-containing protein [Clostridia bacterium]MDZ4043773.1 DUF4321 domain-containing protein [Eubacteriales bacterium]MBU4553434.1 DUF4321 domain-containing protein [Bacillota bacterium]
MAKSRNLWILIVLMTIAGLAGSALGQILSPAVPLLANFTEVGLQPGVLNLLFLTLTFGFSLAIGPLTILGFLLGYLIYRKL